MYADEVGSGYRIKDNILYRRLYRELTSDEYEEWMIDRYGNERFPIDVLEAYDDALRLTVDVEFDLVNKTAKVTLV